MSGAWRRSYKALLRPEKRIGPQPYGVRSSLVRDGLRFFIHRGSSSGRQGAVPDPDSGKFVVVGQNAQGARIEQEMLSSA